MNFIKLLPVIISIAFLSAHYYRAGFLPLVIIISLSLLVLLVRQSWAVRVIQVELFIGGIEWIRTVYNLVMARQSMDMPWVRLALILGAVSLVSFCSICIFRAGSLKTRYRLK